MTPDELKASVDTIVIVMMENRSFDHMLGCLSLPAYGGRTDVRGIEALNNANYSNPSANASAIAPFIAANDDALLADLPHSRSAVRVQMVDSPIAGRFTMQGFVKAYLEAAHTSDVLQPPPMSMMPPDLVPVTHFFAREFTICDNWFAPLPTGTQPNRLMAISGDVIDDVNQHGLLRNQDLVFDWLDQRHVKWRVYTAGISFLALMPKMWPELLSGSFRPLSDLAGDVMHEDSSTFPRVIFVEPDYDDLPVHLSGHASDNHPPAQLKYGEAFLKSVYDALTGNRERWRKTVMIYTYDEHGGFFDHVSPPRIPYAPPSGANFSEAFLSTGPRVPALVISPFASARSVVHELFDHTSMLQMIAERFGQGGEEYSASVAARKAAGVRSVSAALGSTRRADVPVAPNAPIGPSSGPRLRAPQTEAQRSFVAAMESMAQTHGADATARYPQIGHWLANKPPA